MNRILFILVLFFLLSTNPFAQIPNGSIHIEIRLVSLILPEDSSVFICGNIPQLANWNPGKIKMLPAGNNMWTFSFYTNTPSTVEYKFTLGKWEREGAKADGTPLSNFIIKINRDTTITDTVNYWLNGARRNIKGHVTGMVEYHRQLKGNGIAGRDLVVWLPPGYDKTEKKKYPVLYMQDGQNIFDPATSSFGTDWQLDEICDSLITTGKIKPLIVAGIYNTSDRMAEYTPGSKGTAYMDFVTDTVKNFMDKNYRTRPGRKFTWAGGSSAGGTISFMLVWNHSELFSKAFCLSPAFKIDNIDLVSDVSGYSGKKKRVTFYIDNGGRGLEERLQPGIDEMLKTLTEKGYRTGKDLIWISSPHAEHNEAAWAERMPHALIIMLNGIKL
jgi:predicted alpha/beta superfamily hydrolase